MNNFPHHPANTVAGAAVGLTALLPAAQGTAQEWKDHADNKIKDDLKKAWPDAKQQAVAIKAKPAFDAIKNGAKPKNHVDNPPTGDAKLDEQRKQAKEEAEKSKATVEELKKKVKPDQKPDLSHVEKPGSDAPRIPAPTPGVKETMKQSHKLVG
jgi:hypothetical protein